jgi:2-oxo-3-hexenedioate decarboxylase/2-keto-4-pentenoate hydratase
MTPGLDEAAEVLARARLDGPPTPVPATGWGPQSVDEGYRVQAAVHRLLGAQGYGRTVGHKIGCTTAVMQAYLKIDHPCAGEVFESTVFRGSAELPLKRFHRIGVECEIAARLSADLVDGPFTRERVAEAVGSLMAGIELVDDRYESFPDFTAPVLIADDFFNAGVVLGPDVADWRGLDLSTIEGVMEIDGAEVGRGVGADILGHPLTALAWLAEHRATLGLPLRAGEFVMLGSVVKTVHFDAPASVRIAFEGLGEASVRLV